MTEFETSGVGGVSIDDSSLLDARTTLEDELGSDPITVDVSEIGGTGMTDGGRSMSRG